MDINDITYFYGLNLCNAGINMKAIAVNTNKLFAWNDGSRMPVYVNIKLFANSWDLRNTVAGGFALIIGNKKIKYDIIAGVATGGVPFATSLADKLKADFIYVRDKPKEYGLEKQVEGADDIKGKQVIIIDDLISTGANSITAIEAVRNAGGIVEHFFSVFNYEFPQTSQKLNALNPKCDFWQLFGYNFMLNIYYERTTGISEEDLALLQDLGKDPFNWAEKHGLAKINV